MKTYSEVDRYMHAICQTIAKVNHNFVPHKPDDSHTNLYFEPLGKRIVGRWIHPKTEKYLLTLNLSFFTIDWVNTFQKVVLSHSISGKTLERIEEEIVEGLDKIGLPKERFKGELNYEVPRYSFINQPVPKFTQEELNSWMNLRIQANNACKKLVDYLQADTEIRIWPHHFDTGIYVELEDKLGLGFGWAMEDAMAGSPYFYLSGNALQGEIVYENLPALSHGRWELSEHWKGAILTLKEMETLNLDQVEHVIEEFILVCYRWFVSEFERK